MLDEFVVDTCIYTIVHTETLDKMYREGGQGEIVERKPWVSAQRLLTTAKKQNKTLLVLFAPAEATSQLIYFAKLEDVKIGKDKSTKYRFSGLTPFKKPRPLKSSLIVVSTERPLDPYFIRPYAICRTPEFLKNKAN